MREVKVEIYSDAINAAVLRHPGRRFPGVLIQGDTLSVLCEQADLVARNIGRGAPGYEELSELRDHLWSLLRHYKNVLGEHGISTPFPQKPDI